jgi:urease accessory protein
MNTRPGFPHCHRIGLIAFLALLLLPATQAFGHTVEGVASGFTSGFTHPLFGLDHVAAMVAVGLWGGILGRPAVWALPVTFPLVMAMGGVLGVREVPLPGIELGIAVSGIVLGVMVAGFIRAPLAIAAAIVAFFAIFHGYAHGLELPEAANPLAYGAGFVICTGLLHLSGVAVGLLIHWKPTGPYLVRTGGGAIAALGCWFLIKLT